MKKFLLFFGMVFCLTVLKAQDDFETWPLTSFSTTDTGIDVEEETTIVDEGSSSAKVTVNTGSQSSTDWRQTVNLNPGDEYRITFRIYHTEGGVRARIFAGNYENYSSPSITGTWQTLTKDIVASSSNVEVGLRFYDVSGFDGSEVVYVDNFTIENLSALPVELSAFTAKVQRTATDLAWTTASELNNSHFLLQHSTDNRTFTTLEKIAGAGDSDVEIDYAYTHKTPAQGVNYYRLQQFDFDGQSSYSQVVSVRFGDNAGTASIYPNPVSEVLNVAFGEELTNDATAEIVNQSGSVVLRTVFAEKSLTQEVNTANLPAGVYFLRIVSGNEVMTQRFVKK